jgi:hypothetical protein
MKYILSILGVLFFFSCQRKEDEIEIFLLKDRIRTTEGIPVLEYAGIKKIKDENLKNLRYCNYDSIKKQLIYGGKYTVKKEDIMSKPLIKNDEILSLNLRNNELIISESGKQKITQIEPNMKYGVQFVICVDKTPYLTGYFRSNISSYIYNWNYISYDYFEHKIEAVHDKNFVIRQNQGYEKWKPVLVDLNEYPELVLGFRNTNRIVE